MWITTRTLLRLHTLIEAYSRGLHIPIALKAVEEINSISGRSYTADQWVQILSPAMNKVFSPSNPSYDSRPEQ